MQHFMKFHGQHRNLMKSKGISSDPGGTGAAFVLVLDCLFDIGANAILNIQHNRLLRMKTSSFIWISKMTGKAICMDMTTVLQMIRRKSQLHTQESFEDV